VIPEHTDGSRAELPARGQGLPHSGIEELRLAAGYAFRRRRRIATTAIKRSGSIPVTPQPPPPPPPPPPREPEIERVYIRTDDRIPDMLRASTNTTNPPGAPGVPAISPVFVFKVRPGWREPLKTDHVWGDEPPTTASAVE
jgi:hypothetical protein